jgi:beta-galactosidase
LEQDVELVRELGANLVWVTPGPHGSEFYELCDREGLMVVSGVPFTGDVYPGDRPFFKSPAFMQNGRRQLSEMIRQGFNHPSIVMWSIFECVYRRGDDPLPYIKELAELAKKEDPGRLTVCRSNHDGELNFVTDMVLWQHRFGWSSGTAGDMGVWLEHLHRSWSNLYSGVSYGAGGQPREQPDSLMRPSPAAGARHPERWQTLVHEETWQAVKGDSALWCVMLDNMFDSPTPAHSPGINDMGLVSFDRSLRKDAFWFYKAKWNFDHPFVRIAESRWTLRGNPVQTLRVFSNCPRVELFVAGRSIGVQHGTEGVFTWPRVTLPAGRSFIEARSGEASHSAEITISPVLP